MFRRAVVAILLVAGIASACGGSGTDATRSEGSTMSGLSLASATFADGGAIPARHSCDGADVSPPLAWSGVPRGTRALALIVDDPDARGFVHWVVFDLPAEQASLAEDASGGGSLGEGRNDFGRVGLGRTVPAVGHPPLRLRAVRARPPARPVGSRRRRTSAGR